MKAVKKIKKLLKILGPGFITGASDDDPSGIATYSTAGTLFGYKQLWTMLFSMPFMAVIQEMCGRIGMVTGKGLSGVIKKNYPKSILFFAISLLLIANVINIGADLGMMASSIQLLIKAPFIIILIGIILVTLILEIFFSYKNYARYLSYLTLSLLAYVITAFLIKQDWKNVIYSTITPSFSLNKIYILNILAILGTTISPYLFFWQASEEVEEEVEEHKLLNMDKGTPKIKKQDLKNMRLDTIAGMFFSNAIAFFIILTTASTLGAHGISNITTATEAAEALRPLAGNLTFLLFTIGILGTGLLAIPILAGSASYAIGEALGWKIGLYRKFKKAHGFYGIIIAATIFGLFINLTPIPPFTMLYYAAIINGIISPPLLILIMLISNNKKIMGENTNKTASNIMGWIITGAITLASTTFLISIIR